MTRRFASQLLLAILPAAAALAQSKDENRIYDEVRRVLSLDHEVRGAAFVVDVKGGAVTLTGRVRSEKAKDKATKLAKKVKGVTAVTNLLKLPDEK
jgi:osmotically-inducible protein OsmY